MSSKLLTGHIGYIQLLSLFPSNTSKALADISALQQKATLRGVIVDLHGNGGGAPAGIAKLLGAFEHGRAYSYDCTIAGKCTANYPSSRTPPLHPPLAVLGG